jgi:hypothetical protein
LVAVSLGDGRRDENFSPCSAGARAVGFAPLQIYVRVDGDAHDDVPVGLEALLHFLGHFPPFSPVAGQPVSVGENSEKRRIVLFLHPIDTGHRKRLSF